MPKFKAGEDVFRGNVRGLTFALQAVGGESAAKPLLQLVKAGKIPKGRENLAWEMIARTGGPAEVGEALAYATQTTLHSSLAVPVLEAIEASARERKIRPADAIITPAFKEMNGRLPLSAFRSRLAGLWKVESERAALENIGQTSDVFGIDESRSAFEGLALLGGEKTKAFLLDTATRGPLASRPLAVAALAGIDLASAADKAADAHCCQCEGQSWRVVCGVPQPQGRHCCAGEGPRRQS